MSVSSNSSLLPGDVSDVTLESSLSRAPLSVSVEELRSELSLLGFTSVPDERLLQFKQDLEHLMRSRAALEVTQSGASDAEASAWDSLPAWPSSQAPTHRGDSLARDSLPAWPSSQAPTHRGDSSARDSLPAWPSSQAPTHRGDSSARDSLPAWPSSQAPTHRGDSSARDSLPAWPSPDAPQDSASQDPTHRVDSYTKHTVRAGAAGPGQARGPVMTRKVLRRDSEGQFQVCDESLSSSDSRVSHTVKSFIRLPSHSLLEQYRQRSDPVGRYQEYKQSWDALQGSLEKSRKELRWGVRERMMSAPPLPLPRPLPVPNSYVIPTEKKRYGLRWAIRQDLVNGEVPQGHCA